MATGPEMLFKTLMPGFNPQEIFETVKGLGELAVRLQQQLDRMEQRQINVERDMAELLSMARKYPDATLELPNPLERTKNAD